MCRSAQRRGRAHRAHPRNHGDARRYPAEQDGGGHLRTAETPVGGRRPHGKDAVATDFFTKWVEARPIKDKTAIATSQVIANIEKAQERQKEASKRGTKRFKITPGMEVLKKNERKRGRHGQTMDPDWPTVYSEDQDTYASVKPVRRRSQAAWPTKETVANLSEPADSELEEDPLEDLDVVITSVQPGWAYPASLSKRVEDFRAMLSNPSTLLDDHAMDHAQALLKAMYPNVNGFYATTSLALLSTLPEPAQGFVQILNVSANHWVTAGEVQLFPRAMRSPTAEPFVIDVDVHCLCRQTIGQGKAPLVPCRRHLDRKSLPCRGQRTPGTSRISIFWKCGAST
ncbi:unnamed protein product [Boreogadus saida]